jgi:putative SOS response-associated peptidase YedK
MRGRYGSAKSGLAAAQSPGGPYPSDEMTCWPVSTRVGSVKNNEPSFIEQIAPAG